MSKGKKTKVSIEDTLPHQINSPSWKDTGIKMKEPFINKYGVMIGDCFYDSDASPLNQWSDEIDPAIMSGEQWVHPTNDIGWNTPENRELIESKRKPFGVPFTHPDKDMSYNSD
ncbi:DUF3905 domain-containing protein [Metabacillus bambusae]|uniref:DUF3905 domain-containing protein n=1 Tax=Metabacillus bambusae TaxID=2795218 RepID=UPI003557C1F4